VANPKNLKPWQPGQSGNPRGRPRGPSLRSRLRDLLEATEVGGKPLMDEQQIADLVALVIIRRALAGDPRFVKILLDRTEGAVMAGGAPAEMLTARDAIEDQIDDVEAAIRPSDDVRAT
jgi:hypothetical protein